MNSEKNNQWNLVEDSKIDRLERRIEKMEGFMDEIVLKLDKLLELSSAEGRSRTYNHIWRTFPGYINPTLHHKMNETMAQNHDGKKNSNSNLEEMD